MPYAGKVVLAQNTGKPATILNDIEDARTTFLGSLPRCRRDKAAWGALRQNVERVVREMPLWKLQTVGSTSLEVLYVNAREGNKVTLLPGVAFCLSRFHGLIVELVRSAWVRRVRLYNGSTLGEVTDLPSFLFGAERANLAAYVPVLEDLQKSTCFYCRGAMAKGIAVDHFVPWSRYPVDLGHNFVLAHGSCNAAKADTLAAIPHLERWIERNAVYAGLLATRFDAADLPHDLAQSVGVATWAYGQADAAGALTWAKPKELVPVESMWRRLFA